MQTKAILYQNLWNFALLSRILFWVRIALKKFTQVPSYVVFTQVRGTSIKQAPKGRYGLEKPGRFVFGKPVLFTLGLGITTPHSLDILVWNLSRFVSNSVEILTWNFRKKTYLGEFFRNFVQTKVILYKNLRIFALLSEILYWVCIALKKFTQVPSYVVCTQLRRHVHKQIKEGRYGLGKPGRFVFGKVVLFTLGLGLTTPYALGILIWNFYQTFVTVSTEFWLRFHPQILLTRLAINFLFITARADRNVRLCAKLFDFFRGWILIRLTWTLSHFSQIQLRILPEISGKNYFGIFFKKFSPNQGYPLPKLVKFRSTFCKFILDPYCIEKFRKKSHKYFHLFFASR